MIVRKLEEKDIAKCLEIYNYYIENTCFTFEEEKLSLESFKKRCEGICEKYPYHRAGKRRRNYRLCLP